MITIETLVTLLNTFIFDANKLVFDVSEYSVRSKQIHFNEMGNTLGGNTNNFYLWYSIPERCIFLSYGGFTDDDNVHHNGITFYVEDVEINNFFKVVSDLKKSMKRKQRKIALEERKLREEIKLKEVS